MSVWEPVPARVVPVCEDSSGFSGCPPLPGGSGQCGPCFFFLLQKEQCVLLNRENKQVCQVHGENSIKCSGLATGADRLDTNCKEEIEKIYNAVTVGTLSSSCVPKHTLLLLQYWLLLGVRGYVFGPIEEKGNITSPVSIKCERQIRLHYCLGE